MRAQSARANVDAGVAAEAQTKTGAKSRAAAPPRTALKQEGAATEQDNRPAVQPVQPEPQKPVEASSHEALPDRATTSPRAVRQTAQQLCANRSNLVTRVICEAQQCAMPEHSEEAFCKQGREAQTAERRRDAGY
jgi:hypothetical protein